MSWLSDITGVNVDVGRTSARDAFNFDEHFKNFRDKNRLSETISNNLGSNPITGKSGGQKSDERTAGAAIIDAQAKEKAASDSILASQQKAASDFEAAAPGLKDSTFQGVAGQERRRLAGELSGIRGNASSRGLLYSGLRQGSEAKARGESESNLAGQKQGINSAIDEQSQKLKEAPLRSGLSLAEMQNNISNQAMSNALANMQTRQAGYSQMGSAIGQGVGAAMAKKEK